MPALQNLIRFPITPHLCFHTPDPLQFLTDKQRAKIRERFNIHAPFLPSRPLTLPQFLTDKQRGKIKELVKKYVERKGELLAGERRR